MNNGRRKRTTWPITFLVVFLVYLLIECSHKKAEPETASENNNNTFRPITEEPIKRADVEIKFQDIEWGTPYSTVDEKLSKYGLWALNGEGYLKYPVDDVLFGEYKGEDFKYGGINIVANAQNGEQKIAGYTTSEIVLYFAFVPVDGYLTYDEKDTALYGAQYVFRPTDLKTVYADLTKKLVSLYGEPNKVTNDTDIFKNEYTYTHWYGSNDTEIVLRCRDTENDTSGALDDEIYICYAWRTGDTLLKNASDAVKREKNDSETEAQQSGESDGL